MVFRMNPQRTTFNVSSKRAREARMMSRLDSKIIRFGIKALTSFLLFCGLVLLLARSKEGLLVLAPAFWLFMIPLWKNYWNGESCLRLKLAN